MRIEQKTLTILVAEDNGSNFKLIESILGKDYHLLHAWNGKVFHPLKHHIVSVISIIQ